MMLAAENGALPGGKVGGMGDVIRDVPRALAALGHRVTVLTPGYGLFSHLPDARHRGAVLAPYRGAAESIDLFALPLIPRAGFDSMCWSTRCSRSAVADTSMATTP